jgi:serine/threonine protein kinase
VRRRFLGVRARALGGRGAGPRRDGSKSVACQVREVVVPGGASRRWCGRGLAAHATLDEMDGSSPVRKRQLIAAHESSIWLAVREASAGVRRLLILKEANDAASCADLAHEAELMAALDHPNVAQLHDYQEREDHSALLMEYVAGASVARLREMSHGARLAWPIVARMVADVARGLGHAHLAIGSDREPLYLVHRDVTPGNLVVGISGFTKVVDFGIAKSRLRPDAADRRFVRGTPGYLSPEHASGQVVDWRSDVFSLGVVFHELLTGDRLLAPANVAPFETLYRGVPPLPAEVPRTLVALVQRMLALDPTRRDLPMDEIADALETIAAGHGGQHSDVALFLGAELGEELRRRHRLLCDESTSMNASESVDASGLYDRLEATLSSSLPGIGDDPDPTDLDVVVRPREGG